MAINLEKKKTESKNLGPPYHFECTQCGRCCSDPDTIVNLTYSDILRMQEELNYNLNDFLKIIGFYHFDHIPTEKELEQMVIPPIQTERGLAFVGLRKKSNGRCIFLSKKNKCKIYSARPNLCRTFPFHFHSHPISQPKKGLDIKMNFTQKAIEYCPGLSSNTEIDKVYWLDIGKMATAAILKEVILVKKWNKAVEEKKIKPIAENYLRIVLNLFENKKKIKINKKTIKKNYQSIIKRKLKEKSVNNK